MDLRTRTILLLLLIATTAHAQVTVSLSPVPHLTFLSPTGAPLAGGCVWTYISATSTPQATYADQTGLIQNSNPVILDSAGSAAIFLDNTKTYRFDVVTAGGTNCALGSQVSQTDGVAAVNLASHLSQNDVWTGSNTFRANFAINGSEAHFDGESPASTTFTGAKNFTEYAVNGKVRLMDGVNYPFTGTGLQQCINDAMSNPPGICDASAMPSTTFSSQINVGNSSAQPVALILPGAATWSFNITDGVSCGIRQYNKTVILSRAGVAGGAVFSLIPLSSSTNMEGLFCTEDSPSAGGAYVYAERIQASNTVGATMEKGAVILQHLFDNSTFFNITGINSSGVGVKIFDVCCGTAFYNLSADGLSGSGARPLVLGDTVLSGTIASGGLVDVYFAGLSLGHPGSGKFGLEIGDSTNAGTRNAFDENITFSTLYMEPNATNTTTQGIQIRPNVHGIVMNGCNFSNVAGGSTAYFIDIAPWAGPSDSSFINCKSQTLNVINDHVTGLTVRGASNYGQSPAYFSGGTISDKLTVGSGSTVTSSGAGGIAVATPKQATFSAAPTISSGFGTSPIIANNNGSLTFTINVGTGGSAASGVIGLPSAPHGWDVNCKDITTTSSTVFLTKQTATSTTTATLGNFNTAGTAAAWAPSDILSCTATPY